MIQIAVEVPETSPFKNYNWPRTYARIRIERVHTSFQILRREIGERLGMLGLYALICFENCFGETHHCGYLQVQGMLCHFKFPCDFIPACLFRVSGCLDLPDGSLPLTA